MLGHCHEAVARRFCAENGVRFSPTDGEAIRKCQVCFDTHGRETSHNRTSGDRATQTLYRLHLNSVAYRKERYFAFLTDEYSGHIWGVHATTKCEILKLLKHLVQKIDRQYLPRKCVIITEDNGTELPTAQFFNQRHINADDISAHAPELSGRAERTNGIIALCCYRLRR